MVTQELFLPAIHSIINDNVVEVQLQQGSEQKIIAEGQQDIIDLLKTSVTNGVWKIGFERNCVYNFDGLTLFITLSDFRRIETTGEGDIIGQGTLTSDEISFLSNGRGSIQAEVVAQRIEARTEGPGDISLDGTTEEAAFTIRGNGDIRAFDLQTAAADITIRGSGDAEITANDWLKVLIDGSGDVYYKGSPEKDITIDGSGAVKNAN